MSTFGAFTVTRASTKNVLGSNGLYQSVANNVPAFEFNSDGTYRGLLVEPAATNQIRNNTNVGAVAGTPGTLPTNWGESLAGLTREVVATGTENGVDYIDLRFSGTASAATVAIFLESTSQIVASNGQSWTHSAYAKVVSAPTPPTGYQLRIDERTAAGVLVLTGTQSITVGATLSRVSYTRTLSGGVTVERVGPVFVATVVNGNTYDFTIRIGLPQMETGSVATSVIKTTGSTASRVADSVTLTGASSLIGATEGTIYAEVVLKKNTTGAVLSINDGTGTNRLFIQFFSSTQLLADIRVSGVNHNYTATIPAIPANGGIFKVALAYKENDFCFALNGTTYASTASRSVPATTQIDLANHIGGVQLNDNIRSAVLYKERLPNAQLQALTT